MQMYAAAPLFVYAFWRSRILGSVLLLLAALASIAANFGVSIHNNLTILMSEDEEIYIKPWYLPFFSY